MRAGKAKIDVWLEKRQKNSLRKLSKDTGAPLSEIVRRAIEAYLSAWPAKA